MSDMDRFVVWLRETGPRYHAPPETPREKVWARIEKDVGWARDVGTAGDAGDGEPGDPLRAAARYHVPPPAPVEPMWERIESALGSGWASSGDAADLERRRRARLVRWGSGLAIAASLLIGIVIGRETVTETPRDGTRLAAGTEPAGGSEPGGLRGPEPGAVASGEGAVPTGGAEPDSFEPLESGRELAAAETTPGRPGEGTATDPASGGDRPAGDRDARDRVLRYATARHLGRAETLLTAFRATDGPGTVSDIASWAREMLGETRLLLDSPAGTSPRERRLLEELELVLAQIARLSADAPEFERELIVDGMERQGTIARLRAVTPPGAGRTAMGTSAGA